MTGLLKNTETKKQSLIKLLLLKGIEDPQEYDYLKFPGATNQSRFLADIGYFDLNDKVGTIVLPYEQIDDDNEKGIPMEADILKESDLQFLRRTVRRQTGISINTEFSWEIFRSESASKDETFEHHTRIFFGNWLSIGLIPKLLHFPGRNVHDTEKARPITCEFLEIIPFLPYSNLIAAKELMTMLLDSPSDMLFKTQSTNVSKKIDYINQVKQIASEELSIRHKGEK